MTTARWPKCLCEWRGEPVSLYVVPDRSDGDQIEIVGHNAVIWSQNDNAYMLVAETGPGRDRSGSPVGEAVHGLNPAA